MSSVATEAPPQSAKHTEAQKAIDKAKNLLDARIKRIKNNILPQSPYLLTADGSLTSSYIRHIHPNNSNGWRKNTLFEDNERRLQYLSFKDRSSDLERSGMHAHGAWDNGKGGMALLEEKTSLTSSDATTPHPNQGPRKKITLADYKNKDRSKATVVEARALAGEPKEITKAVEKRVEQTATVAEPTKPQASEHHGDKRSADTMTAANEPQILEPGPLLPPAKKASTIPEPDAAAAKDLPKITPPKVADAAVQSDAKAEPQISPSRQINHKESSAQKEAQTLTVKLKVPRMEKTARHGLPLMLSPLSSDIEEELAKRTPTPSIRGDASSAEKAKASKDSLNGTPSSNEKLPASKVLQKTTAKSASTFTKGPQELKGVTSAPHQGGKDLGLEKVIATKPTSNGIANASKGVSSPIVKATVPEAPRKLRLRVTLPIKKKTNRKTLVQYLRMKPTPGKYPSGMRQETHTEVPRSEIKQIEDKASQKRNEPEASRAGEKRRRLQEDHDENRLEPPIKRQKGPGGLPQKTHTPKQSSISSPALSHLGSAQKTYLSTPDVGLTSTPMMRAGSGGSSVYTPHQLAMNCTPAAPDTGNSRTSTNLPAASKPKSGDLRAEAKRFTETGVHLKHDADRFFKNPGGMSDVERKQGVVFGIESVLCFMLSFTFSEMGMPNGDRMSWKSILPFLTKVNEEAPSVKHLAGLALQLESIIRDILVHIDSQRLARNPLDDYFNNPETADPAKTKEQNKTAEFALQFAELRRNADKAQSTLRASWAYLNLEEIRIQFPNTWAKREEIRHPLGKGLETIKAGDYKRTVTLPVSSTTSKLEAVNFGVSILAEFCHKDGMEWQPKLVL